MKSRNCIALLLGAFIASALSSADEVARRAKARAAAQELGQEHLTLPSTSAIPELPAATPASAAKHEATVATGRAMLEASCPPKDLACLAHETGLTRVPAPPNGIGRLSPLNREYLVDFSTPGAVACQLQAARLREPIWAEQTCREDASFAINPIPTSGSGDVFTTVDQSDDSFTIKMGTIGNDYWRTNIYRRQVSFHAGEAAAYDRFVISYLSFDDWIEIKLNSHVVYVGPYGGTGLAISSNQICYRPGACARWELGTSWSFRPNTDLRPYLQPGLNTMDITVVVAGGGEFYLALRALIAQDYLAAAAAAASLQSCQALNEVNCVHQGPAAGCLYEYRGSCLISPQKYLCPEHRPSHEVVACTMADPCPDGICASASASPDHSSDLLAAVLALELSRQAASGTQLDGPSLFAGQLDSCRDKVAWGLNDCCRQKQQAGLSNAEVLAALGANLIIRGSAAAGSTYLYDTLFAADSLGQSLNALTTALPATTAKLGSSFSYYGVQVSFEAGGLAVAFDPASFALAIAVVMIGDLLSCEPNEQVLALKQGAGLCVKVAERCERRALGCYEEIEDHCCYRSKLGRILAAQGKAQLDLPPSPPGQCPGFTVEQFSQLDFDRIDLSELLADVKPAAPQPRQQRYRSDLERAARAATQQGSALITDPAP